MFLAPALSTVGNAAADPTAADDGGSNDPVTSSSPPNADNNVGITSGPDVASAEEESIKAVKVSSCLSCVEFLLLYVWLLNMWSQCCSVKHRTAQIQSSVCSQGLTDQS